MIQLRRKWDDTVRRVALVQGNWNAHLAHISVATSAESRASSATLMGSPPFGGVLLFANILAAAIHVRSADEFLGCMLQRDDRKVLPSTEELDLNVHVADGRLHK